MFFCCFLFQLVSIDKVVIFVAPMYLIAEYFYYKWLKENEKTIFDELIDPVIKSKMLDQANFLNHKMTWSVTQIIFYMIATYMN